jgi:predicted enzyme related to lactoylglutathione lyase
MCQQYNIFKIPADDVNRAKEFYKKVFGWDMQKWSNPEQSQHDYWMFETKNNKGNSGLGRWNDETSISPIYSYKLHYCFFY